MRARVFILNADAANAEPGFDEIVRRTFAGVLADENAVEHFTSLRDATVSIGKAFSDSDTVIFFSDTAHFADTKEILCKALGIELRVSEPLLAAALQSASQEEMDSAFFNVCHAGVPVESQVFALQDALYSGFACKRGRQTVILLPYAGERTRVLLSGQVIPFLNSAFSANVDPAPLQYYYAEQLAVSVLRENVNIAVASTKTSEVFLRYLSNVPQLSEHVLAGAKAENRGNTPPNEYVVNLSITAAEFMGVPYGIAMSNAYYVGNDPNAPKTVYVAVTNDTETAVREIHSFSGEGTVDFLFRCCGELCKLLVRTIDEDAGAAEEEKPKNPEKAQRRKRGKYKAAIAFVLILILAVAGAGGWYFHSNGYTLKQWAQSYLSFLPMFGGEAEAPSGTAAPEKQSEADADADADGKTTEKAAEEKTAEDKASEEDTGAQNTSGEASEENEEEEPN